MSMSEQEATKLQEIRRKRTTQQILGRLLYHAAERVRALRHGDKPQDYETAVATFLTVWGAMPRQKRPTISDIFPEGFDGRGDGR